MSIKEITARTIDKTSNASRLVDKLLSKGLVDKVISSGDGRQVDVYITNEGLELLIDASQEVEQNILDCFEKLTEQEVVSIIYILDKLRDD